MLLSNLNLLATAPGGVARLRELILTLAVQGKLVAQDAGDEPASELLKQIRAEKDRLIAGGKIKKDKPLAAIAEGEAPFELPVGWEWVRWADIAMKIGDIDHKMPSEVSEGVPYISPRDFYGKNEIDFAGAKKIAPVDYLNLAAKIRPEKGDLIYPRYGTIGVIRMVMDDREFLASYSCAVIKVLRGCIEPSYQYLFSMSDCVKRQAASATNKTTQPNVGLKSIQEYLVPLPPLAEQSRIVTRVEELMRLCDALEAKGRLEAAQHAQLVTTLLGTLTESDTPERLADNWHRLATHFDLLLDRPQAVDALEQTILQLAVRGLLVPQDPTDEPASALLKKIRQEKDRLIAAGQIKRDKPLAVIAEDERPFGLPVGWDWVRFDELTHPLKPIAYGVLVPGPEVETGIPFVRIADLSLTRPSAKPDKSIHPEVDKQFPRTRLEGGEILMGVVGSIGKLGIAPPSWAGANIARAICRIVPADAGLSEYVLFLLQTEFMQASFAGDTRTLAQPTLNIGLIRQALTPIPPPAEQSRIVTRVAQLRRLCFELRQRLAASQSTQAQLAEALVENVA